MAKVITGKTLRTALSACLIAGLFIQTQAAGGQTPVAKELPRQATVKTLPDAAYYETLLAMIKKANRSIELATFIFKTGSSPDNRPTELVRELAAASRRGVMVRVFLEDSEKDQDLSRINRETAQFLKKGGAEVLFDSPARTSHAKLAVIDRRYCLVGSHNLTQSALKYNHEFSLLLDSPALAEEILSYLETIVR